MQAITVSACEIEARLAEGWTLTGDQAVIAGKLRSVRMIPPADYDPLADWKERKAEYQRMSYRQRRALALRNRGLD